MAPTAVADFDRVRARDEVTALFEHYRATGAPETREQLVQRFLPLSRHLARKYISGNEREDVEQVAALGLLKAIERFDPARGLAFTSFAVPTILGEIKRYFRDLGWSVRVPRAVQELVPKVERATEALVAKLGRTPTAQEVADHCEVSVEDVLEARGSASAHRADSLDRPVAEEGEDSRGDLMGDFDPGFRRVEQAVDVGRLLATLPEREQKIVRLRFEGDLTQREIAEHVGLSQMHVSRLLRDALGQLAERAR